MEINNKTNRKGKKNPFYGKHHSEKTKRKMRERAKLRVGEKNPFYGKHHSEEIKERMSERAKLKIGEKNPFYGKHHTNETKRKISGKITIMNMGKLNPFYGKHHSKDSKKKISEIKKLFWLNEDKAFSRKPSSFEIKLKQILNKLQPKEWKYTGDGSFLIGYKNPDFINVNGKKTCIEVYHDYFKIVGFGSCKNYEKQRREHFAKYGWDTIFVDEKHLNEEAIKIILFNEQNAQKAGAEVR